jgi:hypothetical protein
VGVGGLSSARSKVGDDGSHVVVFGTSSVWELCERKMAQVSQSIRHGRCGDTYNKSRRGENRFLCKQITLCGWGLISHRYESWMTSRCDRMTSAP